MNRNYPLNVHPKMTTFQELINLHVENTSNSIAFRYIKNKITEEITYKEFRNQILCLSAFFHLEQIQNRHIALLGENSYEWILAYFATVISANVIIPIDKEQNSTEIANLLKHSDADILIYSESYAKTAKELESSQIVHKILCINDFSNFIEEGKRLLEHSDEDFSWQASDPDKLCTIIFTSGTTGKPKGVMLTQRNLISDTVSACENVLFRGPSLLTLPLHHTFAFTAGVLVFLLYGFPICISRSLRTLCKDMQIFQPQSMCVVPLYIEKLYQMLEISVQTKEVENVLSVFGGNLDLLISGGAPIDAKAAEKMESVGIQVLNGYGITECSPVVAVNRNHYYRENSVGQILSCCMVKICDNEILVKGDNVMQGYYKDTKATEAALQDGYFKTGDLGYIDQDGFLFITGRKKNLIILSNGENVSAEELEAKIMSVPNVKEVIVYVESDLITAEVYAENKTDIELNILELNKTFPVYKRIQKIKFRDTEFEKTSTQKIKRN